MSMWSCSPCACASHLFCKWWDLHTSFNRAPSKRCVDVMVNLKSYRITFVFTALWYWTFKKTRLLPDLQPPSQNVPKPPIMHLVQLPAAIWLDGLSTHHRKRTELATKSPPHGWIGCHLRTIFSRRVTSMFINKGEGLVFWFAWMNHCKVQLHCSMAFATIWNAHRRTKNNGNCHEACAYSPGMDVTGGGGQSHMEVMGMCGHDPQSRVLSVTN